MRDVDRSGVVSSVHTQISLGADVDPVPVGDILQTRDVDRSGVIHRIIRRRCLRSDILAAPRRSVAHLKRAERVGRIEQVEKHAQHVRVSRDLGIRSEKLRKRSGLRFIHRQRRGGRTECQAGRRANNWPAELRQVHSWQRLTCVDRSRSKTLDGCDQRLVDGALIVRSVRRQRRRRGRVDAVAVSRVAHLQRAERLRRVK